MSPAIQCVVSRHAMSCIRCSSGRHLGGLRRALALPNVGKGVSHRAPFSASLKIRSPKGGTPCTVSVEAVRRCRNPPCPGGTAKGCTWSATALAASATGALPDANPLSVVLGLVGAVGIGRDIKAMGGPRPSCPCAIDGLLLGCTTRCSICRSTSSETPGDPRRGVGRPDPSLQLGR